MVSQVLIDIYKGLLERAKKTNDYEEVYPRVRYFADEYGTSGNDCYAGLLEEFATEPSFSNGIFGLVFKRNNKDTNHYMPSLHSVEDFDKAGKEFLKLNLDHFQLWDFLFEKDLDWIWNNGFVVGTKNLHLYQLVILGHLSRLRNEGRYKVANYDLLKKSFPESKRAFLYAPFINLGYKNLINQYINSSHSCLFTHWTHTPFQEGIKNYFENNVVKYISCDTDEDDEFEIPSSIIFKTFVGRSPQEASFDYTDKLKCKTDLKNFIELMEGI